MLRLPWIRDALPPLFALAAAVASLRSASAATAPLFQWEPTDDAIVASSPTEAELTLRLRVTDSHYVARDPIRFELAGPSGLRIEPGPLPAPQFVPAPNSPDPVPAYSGETLFRLTIHRSRETARAAARVPVRIVVTSQAFSPQILFTKTQHEISASILFPAEEPGAPPASEQVSQPANGPQPALPDANALPLLAAEDAGPLRQAYALSAGPPAAPNGAPAAPLPGPISPAARRPSASSGWPVHFLFGLLLATLLLDPDKTRACQRSGALNLPLLLGTGLAIIFAFGSGAAAAVLLSAIERSPLPLRAFIWLCVAACLLPGLGYWAQTPRPPWPSHAAPKPPEVSDCRAPRQSAFVALRLLAHAARYGWPAILGSWGLLAGRGTPPPQFACATAALAAGAFAVWALAAMGWSPSGTPRYTTGALGIGYLTAALHLLCLLYPNLRPPEGFPFAQYLISLILVVIGVIIGAVDRPLHGQGSRVAMVKLVGTLCCVAGLFRLTTGLAGPRHYHIEIPPPHADPAAPQTPAPPP